jgi:hypothetical protein
MLTSDYALSIRNVLVEVPSDVVMVTLKLFNLVDSLRNITLQHGNHRGFRDRWL